MSARAKRWNTINELFDAALALPTGDRRNFLARACGDDQELLQEVESLLLADDASDGFLDDSLRLPSSLDSEPPPEVLARAHVGPYRLLRAIDEGGMGAVFLAERADGQFQRTVAIKLIRAKSPSKELLKRFQVERQVLAQLEHPYIARLYEGGETEDQLPFLVMEYVEGLAVDAYCRKHRLDVRQRVDLFRKICAAVHHAHEHLLVHRDLKPSNILITADGTPKLLDFGIAKPLEAQELGLDLKTTEFGSRPMTPAYASPEQVRRQAIRQSSDVYSSGVLLFELLTDASPYTVETDRPAALETAICEQEPMAPSRRALTGPLEPLPGISREELSRQLGGDLDNIVAMALRKEPQQRYASMEVFAEDLRRYLEHLPVLARPEGATQRLMRFCRRHWVPVGIAAAGLLLASILITVFVASTIAQTHRLEREKDTAEQTLSLLIDIFRASDPYQQEAEEPTTRQLLDAGALRVRWEMDTAPEVRGKLMSAIADVYLSLGLPESAEPLILEVLALRRKNLGGDGADLADSLSQLGEVYEETAEYEKSEKALQDALEIRQRVFGENSLEVAGSLSELAGLYNARGQLDFASNLNEKALGIYRGASKQQPVDTAEALSGLAWTRQEQGKLDEAEALYREVLTIRNEQWGADSLQSSHTIASIGLVLNEQGRYEESETYVRKALGIQQKALSPDHPEMCSTQNDLALSVHYQGRLEEAEKIYQEAVRCLRARAGTEHPAYAIALSNRASVLSMLNRLEEAETIVEEALEIKLSTLGELHTSTAQSLNTLGNLRLKLGNVAGAEPLFRRSRDTLAELLGEDDVRISYVSMGLGRTLCHKGDHTDAQALFSRALEVRKSHLPEGDYIIADATSALGECLARHSEKTEEGLSLLRQSYPIYVRQFGEDHPRVATLERVIEKVEAKEKGK